MQVTYPGVYIQEIPSGVRPITAVSTSIAAFVDRFREGPTDRAVRILGFGDFNRIFGGLDRNSPASYAISQFFLNGGSEAWVVRVGRGGGTANPFQDARVGIQNTAGAPIMTVRAANEGSWGNRLRITIREGAANTFSLAVARYDAANNLVATEGPFPNLSAAPTNPRYFPTIVNDESEMIRVDHTPSTATGSPAAIGTLGTALATDINPSSLNGQTFLVRIDNIDDSVRVPQHTATLPTGLLNTTATGVTAEEIGRAPQHVLRAFGQALRTAVVTAGGGPTHPSLAGAKVELYGRRLHVLTNRRANSYTAGERIVFGEVGTGSTAATLGLTGTGVVPNVQEYSVGATANVARQTAGRAGGDGVDPTATELRGDANLRTGVQRLQNVDLFNIVCIPRATRSHLASNAEVTAVVSDTIALCEDRRAFMIIDIPDNVNTVEEMEAWMGDNNDFRHRNTAVFFPPLRIPDPLDDYRSGIFGASGTMAGLFARTDSTRGVWKAPAGVEAKLRGIDRLEAPLTDDQNGVLNPLGINCLRQFPIYGEVSWGARTLLGADEMASEWKYISIRRLALMIEESLFRGTKWVVFEPNDEPLWAKIRQNVGAFMMNLFRQGAFQGDSPDKAFFVKCDGATTTANDRNLGIVNIEVGFAPLKPAEFVVIKIQQIPDVE